MGSCASAARNGCKSPMPSASETASSNILRVGSSVISGISNNPSPRFVALTTSSNPFANLRICAEVNPSKSTTGNSFAAA